MREGIEKMREAGEGGADRSCTGHMSRLACGVTMYCTFVSLIPLAAKSRFKREDTVRVLAISHVAVCRCCDELCALYGRRKNNCHDMVHC